MTSVTITCVLSKPWVFFRHYLLIVDIDIFGFVRMISLLFVRWVNVYFPGTFTRMRNGAYPGSTQKTFNGGDDRISSFPLACTLIFPTIMIMCLFA